MPELQDRLPGEIIFSSFSNELIRRSLQRYADRTARDSENPIPQTGDMAYITTLGITEIFNGAIWDVLQDQTNFAALSARLDVFENKTYIYNDGNVGVAGSAFATLASFTIVTAGDYMFTCRASYVMDWLPVNTGTGVAMGSTRIQQNGADPVGWPFNDIDVGVPGNGEGIQATYFQFPIANLVPTDLIEFEGSRDNGLIVDASYQKRSMYIEQLPPGVI